MASPPVEVLLGIYLGLLTGIIPALVAGGLGFLFRYFTGVTLPGFGVVVLAVGIAGVNGGLLGLIDPSITNSPRLLVALLVVMMLSLYAHSQGDKLGVTVPRRFSLRSLRKRTLSADVVEFVGGMGKVTIRPAGPIADMEGYPPLDPALRERLAEGTWQLPADLPLSELETRLASRLRTEYDLADAAVTIDDRGMARITAAPPMGALSRRVPAGHRAVSVGGLIPSGMARGEAITLVLPDGAVDGTLVSARSGSGSKSGSGPGPGPTAGSGDATSNQPPATDGGETPADQAADHPTAPTTVGGEGRVTVSVPRHETERVLEVDRARIVVRSRGRRREFELVGLLRRAGKRIDRLTIRSGGPLDGMTLGEASVRDTYGVGVLAVRHKSETGTRHPWVFSPGGTTALTAGAELFVVGTRDAVDRFREAVA